MFNSDYKNGSDFNARCICNFATAHDIQHQRIWILKNLFSREKSQVQKKRTVILKNWTLDARRGKEVIWTVGVATLAAVVVVLRPSQHPKK